MLLEAARRSSRLLLGCSSAMTAVEHIVFLADDISGSVLVLTRHTVSLASLEASKASKESRGFR